jgi:TonB-linked SusC/RagA family outer membrane protein
MMKNFTKIIWTFGLLIGITSMVQAQSITGVVYDELGTPMPGVTVRIEGTTQGAATDLDGKYTIKDVGAGQKTIVFSFVGYKPLTQVVNVPPTGSVTANKNMELDSEVLQEYVVVGYGVQRKREVTGAITKVDAKKITDMPTPSFEAGLQGKAAGVQVTTGSGLAGSGSVVRIRGIASISAAGDPLYVVDGIPITQDYFQNSNRGAMNNNPLATINPNDIESIEVLKDAAATGIYGSRGANGVILITTKQGSGTGGWGFNFNSRHGVSVPTARPNMLNSAEWLQIYQEAWMNDGNVGLAPLPGGRTWEQARNTDTDWVDETVGVGFKQAYNFSAQYGTKKLNVFSSIGYDDNGSYLIGNSYERTSFRTNAIYRPNDKWEVGLSTSVSRGVNNRVDAAWSGGLGAAMSTALPIYPIQYSDTVFDGLGNILYLPGDYWDQGSNPVRQRELQDWRTTEWRSINNISVQYTPLKNLFLKAYVGYDYMDLKDDKFTDARLRNGQRIADVNNLAERWPTWTNNWNTNATANYLYDLDENHSFTFLVGVEYNESTSRRNIRISRSDEFVNGSFLDSPGLLDVSFVDAIPPTITEEGDTIPGTPAIPGYVSEGTSSEIFNFMSTFAKVNYALKNKYFAQVSVRFDGSSRFGENNRWGSFPAFSAGWILSEEDFLKGSSFLSYMKLRAGYGITGNAAIPNYQQYGGYRQDLIGYNNQAFRYLAIPPNPNIQWETSNVFDVALETGWFEDRITSTLSFYNKKTTDVLLNISPQPSTGFQNFWDNVGEIINWGVEFELSSINVDRPGFSWRTDFNVAYNYNEIRSIGNYTPDAVGGGTNDTRVVVGKPVGTNFLVEHVGVDPETGRLIFLDINGNQTNTWDPNNRIPVGRVLPKAVGGITNTFTFGRFEVGLVMIFSLGSNIYDSSSKRQLGVVTDWNMRTEIFDRWQQPGDQTEFAQLSRLPENYGVGNPFNLNTTQFLHQGDYLRFRRLSVGYALPAFKVGKSDITGGMITLSATNFLTFTNFPGLDPEIARDFENAQDRNLSSNITYLTPPQEMSFNLALNFNF